MKLFIVGLFILLFSSLTTAEENFFTLKNAYKQTAEHGCYIKGDLFAVGTRKQMNHVELAEYKKLTGYRASDGYAVMMQCLYIVDPLSVDHPVERERKYVWVAS